MVSVLQSLICPLCGKGENSKGLSFSSPRSISLHVSWFAINRNDVHRDWVSKLLDNSDLSGSTINQIANQIDFYLMELVKEAEEISPERKARAEELRQEIKAWTESLGIPTLVNKEGQRTQEDMSQYLRAYAIVWQIETILHSFSGLILSEEHGDNWWSAFPLELQKRCLERAYEDGNQVSLSNYIDILQFSEIIKKNKRAFEPAFNSVHSKGEGPIYREISVFHNELKNVSQIRNKIMHPLKRLTPTEEEITTLDEFLDFVQKLATEE